MKLSGNSDVPGILRIDWDLMSSKQLFIFNETRLYSRSRPERRKKESDKWRGTTENSSLRASWALTTISAWAKAQWAVQGGERKWAIALQEGCPAFQI